MMTHARKLLTFDFWLDVRVIGILLMVLALGSATFGYVRVHGEFDLLTILGDFYANVSAELGSIAITVLIIDTVNRRYEEKQRVRGLKEELIRQAGSPVHATAIHAISSLRKLGWLHKINKKSVLSNADLSNIDLHGVNLIDADLRGVNLNYTNLSNATLIGAGLKDSKLHKVNLAGADLSGANLTNAQLSNANLQYARLRGASIQGANFKNANLKGADLRSRDSDDVNFEGADLTDAIFSHFSFDNSKNVRLPDSTVLTEEQNLGEFGVEARRSVEQTRRADAPDVETFTFADGTQRRWKLGEGWLDAPNTKRANLSGTYVRGDLTDVDFHGVNLSNADLQNVSFHCANLRSANLSGTHTQRITLTGADLTDANLKGMFVVKYAYEEAFPVTNYSHVAFDETTILPDGTNWSPERDLAEFGAETRTILKSEKVDKVSVYTFADGTQRRWKLGEGWLD